MKKLIITILINIGLIGTLFGADSNFQVLHDDTKATTTETSTEYNLLIMHNYIYIISLKQIQLGNKIEYDYEDLETEEENNIIKLLSQLKYYAETDIITLLDISKDKKETLNNYLSETNNTLEKADYLSRNLELEINDYKSELAKCQKQKSASDKSYFQSIEQQDPNIMKSSIDQSKEFDTCIGQNRIEANSKTVVLNKITILKGTLKDKYDFLYRNQNTIINNFQIIKKNLAEDLSKITEILNKYHVE